MYYETLEIEQAEWEGEVNRSSADYVRWYQDALNRLDGARLVVDGICGTLTRAAVRNFQGRKGLVADGIVGPVTESALVLAGAAKPPGSDGAPADQPTFAEPAPDTSVGRARLRVPESDLVALFPTFARYAYNLGDPRYPWPVPGVSANAAPPAPPEFTSCCCFVEAFLVRAWQLRHGSAFSWGSQRHSQAVIADHSDLFTPPAAYIDAGMARELPKGAPPDRWCVVQGWNLDFTSGHTFIVVARHDNDRILTLEANSYYGLNGVGCRSVGMLRNLPGGRPPAEWWNGSSTPTWSSIKNYYKGGIRIARLGVTGQSWAGLPR